MRQKINKDIKDSNSDPEQINLINIYREKRRASGKGRWGGIAWGEMPNVGEGEKESKAHCHVCTYATVLHDLHMYPRT